MPRLMNLGGLYDTLGIQPPCQTALEVEPRSYEVNNNLGNAYVHKGMYAEAIARFRRPSRLKPDSG